MFVAGSRRFRSQDRAGRHRRHDEGCARGSGVAHAVRLNSYLTSILDNAATTPLCDAAAEAMAPYMKAAPDGAFGNANSLHSIGREAFSELARTRVCASPWALGASQRPDEIVVFTSGATEADNAAIVGMALAERDRRRLRGNAASGRVVMSRIEHHAVLHSAAMLKRLGFEVDFVDNDASGHIGVEVLERVMREDTVLVSIMAVNNEVGTVLDTAALAEAAHRHGALFHADAVQALGKIPFNVGALGVDAASFSSHKVGGPQGVGVMYLVTRTPFVAYMAGGGQERGMRSGTQNIAGILGRAAAVEHAVAFQPAFAERAAKLRDSLYQELCSLPKVSATVRLESGEFAPHIVNVCVSGMESQTMILQLDLRGFCVSGGSACSSNSLDPSHVLSALG